MLELRLGPLIRGKRVRKGAAVSGEGCRMARWIGIDNQTVIIPERTMTSKYLVSTFLCVNTALLNSPRKFQRSITHLADEFCEMTQRNFFLKTNEHCLGLFFAGSILSDSEVDTLCGILDREEVDYSLFDADRGLPPRVCEDEYQHLETAVVLMKSSVPLDVYGYPFNIH